MRKLLKGLDEVEHFVDDILIFSKSFSDYIDTLTNVLTKLRQAKLTARPSKCMIGFRKLDFLGHLVGEGTIQPEPHKVEAIMKAPKPETKKQLRSFLGLIGYYRKF